MDIDNKVQEYATKMDEILKNAVEEAYKQGYADGAKSIKPKFPIVVDGIEYVDLDLPSGRLWSSDYLRDEQGNIETKIYSEAIKYNIPTIEDVKELNEFCSIITIPNEIIIQGRNGQSIRLEKTVCVTDGIICTYLTWTSYNRSRSLAGVSSYNPSDKSYYPHLSFKGYPHPIMLVK